MIIIKALLKKNEKSRILNFVKSPKIRNSPKFKHAKMTGSAVYRNLYENTENALDASMLQLRLAWCYQAEQRKFCNKNSFPKAALLEPVVETLHLFHNTDLAISSQRTPRSHATPRTHKAWMQILSDIIPENARH